MQRYYAAAYKTKKVRFNRVIGVLIDIDEMKVKTTCSEIHFIAREMERCMNNIDNLIQSLGQEWKGDAEKAYEQKMMEIRRQYEKMLRFYDSFSDSIEAMLENYEENEMKYMSRINNI